MQYQVVHYQSCSLSEALSYIKKEVEKKFKDGWNPLGGISVTTTDYGWIYVCQAMIK